MLPTENSYAIFLNLVMKKVVVKRASGYAWQPLSLLSLE